MCMLIQHHHILLEREAKYIQMELLKHSRLEAQLDFEEILTNLKLMRVREEKEESEEEERSKQIMMTLMMKILHDFQRRKEVHPSWELLKSILLTMSMMATLLKFLFKIQILMV